MIPRIPIRIAATGLFAAVALGSAPTAAHAAGTNFGIDLSGTILAAGADFKLSTITLTNHGTTTPDVVDVVIDTTRLDTSKVVTSIPRGGCRRTGQVTTCRLRPDEIPAPGASTHDILTLTKAPGATGGAGSLTVSVRVDGDTESANDSTTADVAIGGSDADLFVLAHDVIAVGEGDDGLPVERPITPGGVGSLLVFIANQGDQTADGVEVHVALPPQSTIAEDLDGCQRSTDRRELTCVLAADLVPISKASAEGYLLLTLPVRVAADAKGPVWLPGGVVTVAAVDSKPFTARRAETSSRLPRYLSRPTAAEIAALDADPTDNTDGFAVLVARAASGTGGGHSDGTPITGGQTGGGQAGGTATGSNAGLPVTGPTVLGLGTAGIVVVALGTGLLIAARRRQVVLTLPHEEH